MLTRFISAVIGVGLFLAACFAGSLPFAIAVFIVATVCASEFTRAQKRAASPGSDSAEVSHFPLPSAFRQLNPFLTYAGLIAVPFAYVLVHRGGSRWATLYIFLVIVGVAFGVGLVRRAWNRGGMLGSLRSAYGCIGLWYVGPTLSSFILLRGVSVQVRVGSFGLADRGAWMLLFVAVCVWSTDSFAYFAGRALGKHKMCPALSPAKTWEGFAGGFVGAVVFGALFGHWVGVTWIHAGVVGAIAGLLGPIGDLFESGLKRELAIKDFGNVMPGHGGALDRFDSLMFVAPVAFLYLTLVVH